MGETKDEMYATLDETCPALPEDRPRYLMGVGAPEDIIEAVYRGVDMFDCVLPTRIARNAALLTPDGRINLRNAQYAEDARPVQEDCPCYTCRTFSRAYLRHLYRAGEVTALRLGTIHNVHFLLDLMRRIHQAIADDRLDDLRAEFRARAIASPIKQCAMNSANAARPQSSTSSAMRLGAARRIRNRA